MGTRQKSLFLAAHPRGLDLLSVWTSGGCGLYTGYWKCARARQAGEAGPSPPVLFSNVWMYKAVSGLTQLR